ncbi:MAG TPA: M4 family metallopeptidase [Thermoanaerobaculia bacterium]
MRNIHQYLCSVIPPHILQKVAGHSDDNIATTARGTLTQMEVLAAERVHALIRPERTDAVLPKRRNIYDARHRELLPGKLVMSEHKRRPKDAEVNEAYDGCGATHDFYSAVFNRRSIDGAGMRLDSTVHYGVQFDNAMWNGRQMIYGDGDGVLFNRFTAQLEVIGHELTHGVTQYTAGLAYYGQTGALNEHISDAFGIMVKQYKLGLTASQSDWLIGAGLFGPGVNGKAVRSMAAPGTAYDDPVLGRDPQPSHMKDYVDMVEDRGGVHINSGIPNHAFYLAAMSIGGEPWTVLGHIWYVTLTRKLPATADFGEFASQTVAVAGELYGAGGAVQRAVAEAWATVGVPVHRITTRSGVWGQRPVSRAAKWQPHRVR